MVIRPLLGCEKAALESYCREQGLAFVVDSTNEDISYARNRIRRRVIPELRTINPAVTDAAARLSETVRADVSFLSAQTDAFVREWVTLLPCAGGSVRVSAPRERLAELSGSLRRRVLVRMMQYAGCPQAEERFVRALGALSDGAISLPGGVAAVCERGELWLCRENKGEAVPPSSMDLDLTVLPQTVAFGDFQLTFDDSPIGCVSNAAENLPFSEIVYKMSMNAALKFDTIKGSMILRTRRSGDLIRLLGHHRRVKKLFCDMGVPLAARDTLPLLCDGEGIAMIPGIGVRDELTPETDERILYVSVRYHPCSEYVSASLADRNIRNQQKEETDEE